MLRQTGRSLLVAGSVGDQPVVAKVLLDRQRRAGLFTAEHHARQCAALYEPPSTRPLL